MMQVRHQVLAVQDPDDIVQNALVNRESGVPGALHRRDNFIERHADLDGRDFHSRDHHVLDLTFRKLEDPFEHSSMFVALLLLISARNSASDAALANASGFSWTLRKKKPAIFSPYFVTGRTAA